MLNNKLKRRDKNRKFLQSDFLKKNRRGTLGETVTWFIAIVIIFGIVLASTWISFGMSKVKAITIGDVRTDLGKNSEQLATKTSIAEQINNQNQQIIDNLLKQNG
jgi:hypothetical protein